MVAVVYPLANGPSREVPKVSFFFLGRAANARNQSLRAGSDHPSPMPARLSSTGQQHLTPAHPGLRDRAALIQHSATGGRH